MSERCPHGLEEVDPVTGAGCGACLTERANDAEDTEYRRHKAVADKYGLKLCIDGPIGSRCYWYEDGVALPDDVVSEDNDGSYYIGGASGEPEKATSRLIEKLEALASWATDQAARLGLDNE